MSKLEQVLYWQELSKHVAETAVLARDSRFRAHYTMLARRLAGDCCKYVGAQYGHKLGRDFMLRVKCKWDLTNHRSSARGGIDARGRGFISINMVGCVAAFDLIEYQSFVHDLEIGYLATSRREVHLAGIVAHEVAHAAVFSMKLQSLRTPQLFSAGELDYLDADGGHGPAWKSVYRFLRNNYVTKIIEAFPDQAVSKIWSNS